MDKAAREGGLSLGLVRHKIASKQNKQGAGFERVRAHLCAHRQKVGVAMRRRLLCTFFLSGGHEA